MEPGQEEERAHFEEQNEADQPVKKKRRNLTAEKYQHMKQKDVIFTRGYLEEALRLKKCTGCLKSYAHLEMTQVTHGKVTGVPKSSKKLTFTISLDRNNVVLQNVSEEMVEHGTDRFEAFKLRLEAEQAQQ